MVTHDPVAAGYTDRVVFLADGRVVDELRATRPPRRCWSKMKRARASARSPAPPPEPDAMRKVTWRNLMARKLRLALSAFAIVLGVAFVAGSFIFTDALSGAFNGIVNGTTADVEVCPTGACDFDSAPRTTGPFPAVGRSTRSTRSLTSRRRTASCRPRAST